MYIKWKRLWASIHLFQILVLIVNHQNILQRMLSLDENVKKIFGSPEWQPSNFPRFENSIS